MSAIRARQPVVIAHRGAPGLRIEHTVPSYRLALEAGADVIEPDLVVTADAELVVRHDVELSTTTDVAARPQFRDRRRTLSVDGRSLTGWFVHDFTLAELRELRCVERWPGRRPANVAFDGQLSIVTFDEVIDLAVTAGRRQGRSVAVWPELKSPSHFAAAGLDPVRLLACSLRRHRLDRAGSPIRVQCFEPSALRRLAAAVPVPLLQLAVGGGRRPYDHVLADDPRTFTDLLTDHGLAEIATYADAVGLDKGLLLPAVSRAEPQSDAAALVERAARHGLGVYAWTFRNENEFLPPELRRGDDPGAPGDAVTEYRRYFDAGVDGVFSDHPATALAAREAWLASLLQPVP